MPPQRRASFGILFLALVATVPVPYYLGGFEIAPTLRLLFLTALFAGVALTEGAVGNQLLLTLLSAAQALLWTSLAAAASALLARALLRLGTRRLAAIGALATLLFCVSLLPIYRTPMSSRSPTCSILGIFD